MCPDPGNVEENEIHSGGVVRRCDRLTQRDAVAARRGDKRSDGGCRPVDCVGRIRDDEGLIHRCNVCGKLRGLNWIERRIESRRSGGDDCTRCDIGGDLRAPCCIARSVSQHIDEAEIGLPLTIAGSITGGIGENLDAIVRVGRSGKSAAHR